MIRVTESHRQVDFRIPIQVSRNHRGRRATNSDGHCRLESPIPVSKQDAQRTAKKIFDYQIKSPIAIEITNGDGLRIGADTVVTRWKVPSAFLSKILTSLLTELATAMSKLPSPLKSPTAAAAGTLSTGYPTGLERLISAPSEIVLLASDSSATTKSCPKSWNGWDRLTASGGRLKSRRAGMLTVTKGV
ncbi:MAG TPA: hypothetical protein VMG82_24830 [Candidatus Sulfotelmatobacter sp.]|nr:hypothetical protein [Candidatus Sulfotelmatobacter sp.]